LKPAFTAAVAALSEIGAETEIGATRLSQQMIERVLAACAEFPLDETGKLFALLRRYEMEAARENARHTANALADETALALAVTYDSVALIEFDPDRMWDAA
jgi:hypothetical protein